MDKFQLTPSTQSHVLSYTPPKLFTGKDWYIGFMALDPAQGRMRRKRYKLNFIEKIGDRRRYAQNFTKELFVKLESGWNPWIESEHGKAYHTISDVFAHYRRTLDKLLAAKFYRDDTHTSYLSYLRNFEKWNIGLKIPLTYIYQIDNSAIRTFLEYIYIDRNNTAQTRNNYLGFLQTLSTWLVEKQYLKTKPTAGIQKLGKHMCKKQRTIISEVEMIRLKSYLETKNKHYLLACYILHYCFVRPKEMSMIRVGDISLKNQTLFIPEDNSKNRQGAVVAIPVKVIHLMLDLNIFSHAGSDYLFSHNFMPGREHRSQKQFRDFWTHYVRKQLKFPESHKFYSLKDTGITSMLRRYDKITVKEQARHSSILTTEVYTPHDLMQASELIKNHESVF